MADFRRLAKTLILADGHIGQRETDTIKKELLTDKLITRSEAEFLFDLRQSAKSAVPDFHSFVFEVTKKILLKDGAIDAPEAEWLKHFLLGDGKLTEQEKQFLRELAGLARQTSPEFDEFVRKYA